MASGKPGAVHTVSRELGVTAATLTGWHDAFLAGGEAAPTTRAATGEALESDRLKAKLGAALIERDLLNQKIALLEAGRPFARKRRRPEPRPVAAHRQAVRLGRALPGMAARPLGRVSPPLRPSRAAGAAARTARRDVAGGADDGDPGCACR